MSLDWTSTACEARSYLNANIIKMEGLIAFNISNILSRLKATKAILQLLTKLWSIKNINICLASGMWAGTGTKPNFTPKIYFTELGKFSCIQKPVRVELLTPEEQDKGLGDADPIQDHFCHHLEPWWLQISTSHKLLPSCAFQHCWEQYHTSVFSFYYILKKYRKIPSLNTQADCFHSFMYLKELTISLTIKCPEEKAIELGGVETGNMNA